MQNKLVSIITRTKDRFIFIPRVFKSVVEQTYRPLQWIIVNDNGEDISLLLEQLKTEYKSQLVDIEIILLNRENSTTMEAATNTGLNKATGFYIKILDDDDTLETACIRLQVKYMEEMKLPSEKGVISYSNLVYEKIENNNIKTLKKTPWIHLAPMTVSLTNLTIQNQFTTHSFLYEQNVFESLASYDESLPVLGDWEFNLRFLMKFDIGVLPEFLVNYHKRTENENYANTDTILHHKYETAIRNQYIRHSEKYPVIATLMAITKYSDNREQEVNSLIPSTSSDATEFTDLPKLIKSDYEAADILRDIAQLFENKGDIKTAYALMTEALNQRPDGPAIKQKMKIYRKLLDT